MLTFLTVNGSRNQQLKVFLAISAIVFLLTATRWEYGGDWDNYLGYFQNIRKLDFDEVSMEPGWVLLSYILKKLTDSYVAFQFVMAGIIFFCIFKSIKHFSVAPILTYLVFFAVENGAINYVRTAVATYIFLYLCIGKKITEIFGGYRSCMFYPFFGIFSISVILDLWAKNILS